MELTEHQQEAVDFLLTADGRELGLRGWAGTGKTFTTARYVRAEQARGRRVVVLAPTHRACGVLREELAASDVWVEVMTVHAGCGLVPCLESGKSQERTEPRAASADVVIVDEASMLDDSLLAKVRKLRAARIVFVGDPYQLSPVSAARGTPAFHARLPVARLSETQRYAPGSVLDELTGHLRRCIDERKLPNLRAIERVMSFRDGGTRAAARLLDEGGRDSGVILTYTNRLAFRACQAVQDGLRYTFEEGDPVSFLGPWAIPHAGRGPTMRIHSGTEGVVLGVREEREGAVVLDVGFADGGRQDVLAWSADTTEGWMEVKKTLAARMRCSRSEWIDFVRRCDLHGLPDGSAREAIEAADAYACLRQTWATTCHKAQGGSYDRVIVMWDDVMIARRTPETLARMLYVAVTRVRDVDQLFFVRGEK